MGLTAYQGFRGLLALYILGHHLLWFSKLRYLFTDPAITEIYSLFLHHALPLPNYNILDHIPSPMNCLD